jgi:hypothetical protein
LPVSSSVTSRESQAAIITALISADPEMQKLAREYVLLGLAEMIHQLRRGDASTRAAIAKSMSGAVTNLLTQQAGDDGLTDLRTEMHQMMAEVRGDMGAHEDRLDDEELVGHGVVNGQARAYTPKS